MHLCAGVVAKKFLLKSRGRICRSYATLHVSEICRYLCRSNESATWQMRLFSFFFTSTLEDVIVLFVCALEDEIALWSFQAIFPFISREIPRLSH